MYFFLIMIVTFLGKVYNFLCNVFKAALHSWAPSQQGIPLINEKTKEITELNHLESPLLRLPGELRNIICEYVLGSILIKVWQPEVPVCYDYRIGFCYYPDSNRHTQCLLFSLLKVSRTTYAETHLMPLALNTVVTSCNEAFSTALDRLTPSQRSAITTIQYMPYGGPFKLLQEVLGRGIVTGDPILDQDWTSEWQRFEVLKRLGGLRNVTIGNYGNPNMAEALEDMLVAGFREAAGNQNIEVEFLGRTAWACLKAKLPLPETVQLECRLRI